jgi:hypothetical protein
MNTQPYRHRFAVAIAVASATLALAEAASAIDLRDWGRKLPASERFVVLSQFANQAVLDKETQLVWERAPDPTLRTWGNTYSGRCPIALIGGRMGWRMPTRAELMSLLNPTVSSAIKLPSGHPFIGLAASDFIFTSEISTSGTAASVGLGSTVIIYTNPDSFQARAWCVRG